MKSNSRRAALVIVLCIVLGIWLQAVSIYAAQEPNIGAVSPYTTAYQNQPTPTIQPTPEPQDVPQGYTIIEGDILVRYEPQRQSTWDTKFWPNGIVPYEFDGNVSADNKAQAVAAMAEWQAAANVQFVARTNESNYIHIQSSPDTNNSSVGMQGGKQFINIVNWDWKYKIAHELGHALGFGHEQSRPDRDNFIRINDTNVEAGKLDQFERHGNAGYYGPYDFDSVMHYGQCFFSANPNCDSGGGGETITVLSPNETWQDKIGQRDHLSRLDKLTMSFLYPQDAWRFVDRNYAGFQEGRFFTPFQDLASGIGATPNGGTLWIQPGSYAAVGVYNRPMTIQAPLGGVVLGR